MKGVGKSFLKRRKFIHRLEQLTFTVLTQKVCACVLVHIIQFSHLSSTEMGIEKGGESKEMS